MLGTIHAEWVELKGKPHLYELSVYMSDMTHLNLYIVTDGLAKQPDTLENLGFVANPDRHEFYFVQVGIGCVKAISVQKAFDRLCDFLESKRSSAATSENRNNGLVLVTNTREELAVVLRAIDNTKHDSLLLDVVKGFGCLEVFIDRNRSRKLTYGGPKLNLGGDECFYHTEAKKGLAGANLVSKCKAEALFQTIELFLDKAANYKNFIQPYCFPSFSPALDEMKKRLGQMFEMYPLVVFIAANLKSQERSCTLYLEGVFAPSQTRDLRDKATIVASRLCRVLVEAGLDKDALYRAFKRQPEFAINSSVVLERMSSMPQRLKVMDQTVRAVKCIRHYFSNK